MILDDVGTVPGRGVCAGALSTTTTTTAATTGSAEKKLANRRSYSAEQVPRCWPGNGLSWRAAITGLLNRNHQSLLYRRASKFRRWRHSPSDYICSSLLNSPVQAKKEQQDVAQERSSSKVNGSFSLYESLRQSLPAPVSTTFVSWTKLRQARKRKTGGPRETISAFNDRGTALY